MTTRTSGSNLWARASACAVAAIALAACGETGGRGESLCQRAPELLLERRECRADEDCPCGAGCELGVCEATCAGDAECGDGWCDDFGRCREPGDTALVPELRAAGGGGVRASTALVRLTDPTIARPFDIVAERAAIVRARVEVDEGLAVRCAEDGAFASECTLDAIPEGGRRTIWVRGEGAFDAERGHDVRIFTEEGIESVGVTTARLMEGPMPADVLAAGVLEGTATLIAMGSGTDPRVGGAPGALALPIRAQLFLTGAASGVLSLEDPSGVLADGAWIGRIAPGASGAPELDLPTVTYLDGDGWAGAGVEVLASVAPSEISMRGHGISFDVVVRLEGVVAGARAPFVRWRVALARTGDLPAGATAPSVPADVAGSTTSARALDPVAWEDAARIAIGDENVFTTTDTRRRVLLASFARTSTGQEGTLAACTLDAADIDALGRFAVAEAWGTTGDALAMSLLDPTVHTRVEAAFRSSAPTALALTIAPVPSSRPRVLPCEVTFTTTSPESTCDAAARYRLGALDVCDEMAAAYGCAIEPASGGTTFDLAVSGTLTLPTSCTETLAPVTIPGAVSRVCRLPVTPEACGELALCYSPPAVGDPDEASLSSLTSVRFADTAPLGVSGDLTCEGGERTFFALDLGLEQTPCPPGSPACDRLNAQQIVDACSADLARVRASAPASSSLVHGMRLRELFASSPACADVSRLVLALGLATEADRRRAIEGSGAPSPIASRVAQRIVQRIAQQTAFAAREAAQRERIAEMYRESSSGGRTYPRPEETLDELLPVWDLLLHPRFATALDAMQGETLVSPDYRDAVLGRPVAADFDELGTAVPVAIVDLASAELDLLERRLEWAALDGDSSALAPLARTLRYTTIARALASDMTERARIAARDAPPSWIDRFQGALLELDARTSRLLQQASTITSGRNPLGIEEDDLPLYFFGDESTPTTRFSAVSDFLIGQMPGSVISGSAWSPALVQIARDAWDDGLPYYIDQLDRQVQVRQSEAELEATLEEIRLSYGAQLGTICYPDDLATRDLLESWAFDENTCFYRSTAPSCVLDPGAIATLMTTDRVGYQMCIVGEERRAVGPFVTLGSPEADRLADDFSLCGNPRYPEDCPAGVDAPACLACDLDGARVLVPLTADDFRAVPLRANLPALIVVDAQTRCLESYPGVDPTLPSEEDLPGSPITRRDCYNGTLGEAIYELRAAEQDVVIARREFEQGAARYDIAVRSCARQHLGDAMIGALLTQHGATMTALESTKLGLDIAAEISDAAGDCFELTAGIDLGSIIKSAGAVVGLTVAACVARATSASLRSGAAAVEMQMTVAERSHELAMQMTESETAFQVCMNDAEMEMVEEAAATERVNASLLQTEAAAYRIQELQVAARTIYEDGRGALEAARGRYVRPLTHDFWLDAQVDRFWRDMRLARRVTYLSVRAVEYETQQSLPYRTTVLRARLPDELWGVLTELWTMTGTRSVGGNRPTDLKVVLSLRSHLLQLADRSDFGAGEHSLSDAERFRMLLTSPRHALYDDDGTYLGQRIPFTLAPLGSGGIGDPQGIPVLAGSDCAERLWSVNASVLGEELYRGDAPTFTRIDLLKSNTFSSQWCVEPAAGAPRTQITSVRPSRNLFRDPELGTNAGVGGALGLGNEATLESRARIEAYFNVDRATLESDDYANGATSELAARGLYGDYALFIPADVIAREGGSGLVLENVEDILLRLDYVSVAR